MAVKQVCFPAGLAGAAFKYEQTGRSLGYDFVYIEFQ
jgi:hypothetical protein